MKVGIITHYYKSVNYGGNLQAYALCKFLEKKGYSAEQISYDISKQQSVKTRLKLKLRNLYFIHSPSFAINRAKRKKAILSFNENRIPHSKRYNCDTIKDSVNDYGVFIVGSDQVWHPNAVCDAYLLDFVPSEKTKISYAASLAVNELSEDVMMRYKKSLACFDAISVREDKAKELLSGVVNKEIEVSVDPTLLLSRDEWDNVCSERQITENYLFCYFLGDDLSHRKLAREYAEQKNLKIVTLPNLKGKFRECDNGFGDCLLYNVSPSDFISLIKHSQMVFTDSFHATVFSLLYEKEFFAFERNTRQSMGSRLYTLTSMFGVQSRFCDTAEKLSAEYVLKETENGIKIDESSFIKKKEASAKYLENNLKKI